MVLDFLLVHVEFCVIGAKEMTLFPSNSGQTDGPTDVNDMHCRDMNQEKKVGYMKKMMNNNF